MQELTTMEAYILIYFCFWPQKMMEPKLINNNAMYQKKKIIYFYLR